ncbi:hypothetical protein, partial [Klebsiella pneumoniae]|uniref:hypothetical protein n=1 Tax=Klebsiella pneumoniae TaxID=573 RepID=UPI00371E9753
RLFRPQWCLQQGGGPSLPLGRPLRAERLEVQAIAIALFTPTDNPKLRWEHDGAIQNIALSRATRGDVDGALTLATSVRDDAKRREMLLTVVDAAIRAGHGSN